ncbi:MAG: helix-turn-helix domain-containing protein [Alistipes onderdonkii]
MCAWHAEKDSLATAQDEANIVVLSLIHRIEFCEQDIFDKVMPYDTVIPNEDVPKLAMHPSIERLLEGLFMIPEMSGCSRYHKMKATELFMMIKVLYTPTEHAYFFQSMIQPQDNFRVFVCNNYDKAQGVAELAALAGMSLSVFKRRFAEHFNDSVYHWMMRQKALKIFSDIRDGEDSTKALMNKYGFRHYTQFSRFCKNYLQAHACPADRFDQGRVVPVCRPWPGLGRGCAGSAGCCRGVEPGGTAFPVFFCFRGVAAGIR